LNIEPFTASEHRPRWTLLAGGGATILDEPYRRHKKRPRKLHGEDVVAISGSSVMGLATTRLTQHEGAEVTIGGRS
jgi:hypothetical protein